MTPETEFSDLLDRTERMWNAALLLIITFLLLLVSGATLLCTVFVTFFSMTRNGANEWTEKVTAARRSTFRRALPVQGATG
jgi:hypothetical protein